MKFTLIVALLVLLTVAGCGLDLSVGGRSDENVWQAVADSDPKETQVTLNPSVFLNEDRGLWDGRPSFGGVWVAIPSAKLPERVLIEDVETGKSVLGALFRREVDVDGPPIQISSEAARGLGLLAGQPVRLRVTAVEIQAPELGNDDP